MIYPPSLKTISGANIENEYYKPTLNNDGSISFTKNSDSAVINNNVATTLHITIKDVFGNTINKEIPFTVVKP
jgi:DNA-binding XRE family transcriptional regulator